MGEKREEGEGEEGGPGEGGGGRSRAGSWLQRLRSSRSVVAASSQDEESDGEPRKKVTQTRENDREDDVIPVTSPLLPPENKYIKPAQKLERFESKEEEDTSDAHPTDPPSSPAEKVPPAAPQVPPRASTLPPQPTFRTPTRAPMRHRQSGQMRRAHTRQTFSPPPPAKGASPAHGKYRREHKR